MGQHSQQGEVRKTQIIAAAARVFAQKGFSGAVIAEIAAEAGIGKGTVYEYFNSKEDLFFAVFQWLSRKIASAATVKISALGGSASQRLMALNESVVNSILNMMDMFSLVLEFWAASSSAIMRQRFKAAFKQTYRDFRSIVSSVIRDGMESGEFSSNVNPESLAAALVGAWDALFLQAWFDETFDPLVTAQDFMALVIQGLMSDKT
jgi:AcrR family transcriptional regulator